MRITYSFSIILKPVLTALFIICPLAVLPQETSTCAENLKNAQALFTQGQVEKVPEILQSCLKSGFTSEEELSAYKLIIQCLLFEDRLAEADSAMLEFLRKNPEYELSPTDHSSFVTLFNNFKVKPVVQISLHFGTNIPYLTFIGPESATGEKGESDYSTKMFNLFISLEAKFKLKEYLEVNFEPGYSQLSFTNNKKIPNLGTTTYIENQKRLELPVSATCNFKTFGKFTLYGRLGTGPALSLGTSGNAEFKSSDANGDDLPKTDFDRKASRIVLDLFVQGGAGIKLKTPGGFIFSELRSNISFFDQVIRAGSSYEEQELSSHYKYADDDFNINAVNFTVGYTQIFYKPSKK
jgi:hypothetical protein